MLALQAVGGSPLDLLDRLGERVTAICADYSSYNGRGEMVTGVQVFPQVMPATGDVSAFPLVHTYIAEGEDGDGAACNIGLIIGSYDVEHTDGWRQAVNMGMRIRHELLRSRVIDGQYSLVKLRYSGYEQVNLEQRTFPVTYFQLMLTFKIPAIMAEDSFGL